MTEDTMTEQQFLETLNNDQKVTYHNLKLDWIADDVARENRLREEWIADNLATDEQCVEYILGENEAADFARYAVPTDSFALHAVAESLAIDFRAEHLA